MITEMVGHKQLHTTDNWRCRECLMCDKVFSLADLILHLSREHGYNLQELEVEKSDGEIWRKISH